MAGKNPETRQIWTLVARQYGVISRRQLLRLGLTSKAIEYRMARGRLHQVHSGVYAVGRPELTRDGLLMAAVLACGPDAFLSGNSAGEHYGVRDARPGPIEVTVRSGDRRGRPGIKIRVRALPATDLTTHRNIPLTTPIRTLIDLAATLRTADLERAINQADKLDLVDPETLRIALDHHAGVAGVTKLRTVLDRRTFTLTDTKLEQIFLPIARRVGLPKPLTQLWINGFRVDFFWPDLGLVVETDGLRYHRTPAEQARDHVRDQTHVAAGLTPLRFTRAQVKFEPAYVESVLRKVTHRIATKPSSPTTPNSTADIQAQ